jgi:PAS domain S-box-containing protein
MADADGWIFWYNRKWYEYTGKTLAELEGWGWQSVHDPAELPRVVELWRRALDSGDAGEMIFPLKGSDGNYRPFLTRVQPIKDERGQVVRWVGTNTDISEQHTATESLQAEKRRLETLNQTIAQVSAELDLERLVQKVTTQGSR